MHRNVELNSTAQATFDTLSPAGKNDIRQICVMMEDFWEVLEVVPGEPLMQKPDAFGCNPGDYT